MTSAPEVANRKETSGDLPTYVASAAASGRPVSFWHAVTGGDPAPTYADLAQLLAAFHGLGDGP